MHVLLAGTLLFFQYLLPQKNFSTHSTLTVTLNLSFPSLDLQQQDDAVWMCPVSFLDLRLDLEVKLQSLYRLPCIVFGVELFHKC